VAAFDPAYNNTMDNEGRKEETVLDDPGGRTFWGISEVNWPTWPGWAVINANGPNDPSLPGMVKMFYQNELWVKMGLSGLTSQLMANNIFDMATLFWRQTALKTAQRAVNLLNMNGANWPDVRVDGASGPATINALNSCYHFGEKYLSVWNKLFDSLRVAVHAENTEKNHRLEKFIKGWVVRAFRD
jgi:lysozyme family protein